MTLNSFTKSLLHSTLLYIALPWLYFILHDSKFLYQLQVSDSLYFTLPYSDLLYHGSTSLYMTLHYSTTHLILLLKLYKSSGRLNTGCSPCTETKLDHLSNQKDPRPPSHQPHMHFVRTIFFYILTIVSRKSAHPLLLAQFPVQGQSLLE